MVTDQVDRVRPGLTAIMLSIWKEHYTDSEVETSLRGRWTTFYITMVMTVVVVKVRRGLLGEVVRKALIISVKVATSSAEWLGIHGMGRQDHHLYCFCPSHNQENCGWS